MNEVKVSVLSTTYNHESYVEDAIKGVLGQKTDFPFELIIHDDCSSDGTQDIIRSWQKKHPTMIHAILQKENQYSKGKDIYSFLLPAARGEYLAFCEGDDFWTDDRKLQKQVAYLDAHPDVVACVHNTSVINMQNGRKKLISSRKESCDLQLEDFLMKGSTAYHTSSLVIRKETLIKAGSSRLMKAYPIDYSLALSIRLQGKIHFLPDVMSVYRQMSGADAWSSKMEQDKKKAEYGFIKHLEVARLADQETGGQYSDRIDPVIVNYCQRILQGYPLSLRWKMYRRRLPMRIRTGLGRVKRLLMGRK